MDELDCSQFLRDLYLLLDDEIPQERCARLRAHMQRCADCLGHHEVERAFKELMRRTCGGEQPPPSLLRRIRAALRSEAGEP